MSNETSNASGIIGKVWSFCNTLRDELESKLKHSRTAGERFSEAAAQRLATDAK